MYLRKASIGHLRIIVVVYTGHSLRYVVIAAPDLIQCVPIWCIFVLARALQLILLLLEDYLQVPPLKCGWSYHISIPLMWVYLMLLLCNRIFSIQLLPIGKLSIEVSIQIPSGPLCPSYCLSSVSQKLLAHNLHTWATGCSDSTPCCFQRSKYFWVEGHLFCTFQLMALSDTHTISQQKRKLRWQVGR